MWNRQNSSKTYIHTHTPTPTPTPTCILWEGENGPNADVLSLLLFSLLQYTWCRPVSAYSWTYVPYVRVSGVFFVQKKIFKIIHADSVESCAYVCRQDVIYLSVVKKKNTDENILKQKRTQLNLKMFFTARKC